MTDSTEVNAETEAEVKIAVRNPRYTTEREGYIDCEILHTGLGWIPFTASCHDIEQHGQDIYERIISGECGEIAPCPYEHYEGLFEARKNAAIAELNNFCSNPLNWAELTPEQQQEAMQFRQQLKALQFADANLFPEKPVWLE